MTSTFKFNLLKTFSLSEKNKVVFIKLKLLITDLAVTTLL